MKKYLLLSFLILNLFTFQSFAQCEETHKLCVKQFSKEDRKAGWNINKQSESLSVEKGKVYETTLTAHKGLEYRLSACTDVGGGTPVTFQVSREISVTVTDKDGNTNIEKQREVIFDNSSDPTEFYVLFRSSKKNEKFYITVDIPASGKSKKLKNAEFVCLGLLLEHRRVNKSAL